MCEHVYGVCVCMCVCCCVCVCVCVCVCASAEVIQVSLHREPPEVGFKPVHVFSLQMAGK